MHRSRAGRHGLPLSRGLLCGRHVRGQNGAAPHAIGEMQLPSRGLIRVQGAVRICGKQLRVRASRRIGGTNICGAALERVGQQPGENFIAFFRAFLTARFFIAPQWEISQNTNFGFPQTGFGRRCVDFRLPIFKSVREAPFNLRGCEGASHSIFLLRPIGGDSRGEYPGDRVVQLEANVSQVPRNRNLRHSSQLRHLGAVELFRVVQSREEAVRGRERCDRIVESLAQCREVRCTKRVEPGEGLPDLPKMSRATQEPGRLLDPPLWLGVANLAPCRRIYMALGNQDAQPGSELATAMIVAQPGAIRLVSARANRVKLIVERVHEFPSINFALSSGHGC